MLPIKIKFKEKAELSDKIKFGVLIVIMVTFSLLLIIQLIPTGIGNVKLPDPDTKGSISISKAIEEVEPSKDLESHELDLEEISQLCYALQGVTHDSNKRTVPSAGALYPLEIFLLHKGNSALRKGIYRYEPSDHSLELLSETYNRNIFSSPDENEEKELLKDVGSIFLIMADYKRTTNKYGDRGIQYVHLEVGHAIQNFFLQTVSLDLDSYPITIFDDDVVQDCLDTKLMPLVILPVGKENSRDSSSTLTAEKDKTLTIKNEMTVEEAISSRKSTRDYSEGEIPLDTVEDMLEDCSYVSYLIGDDLFVSIHLVAGEIEDLDDGVYKYDQENESLTEIISGDKRSELKEAALNQKMVSQAQLDIVLSVNTELIDEDSDLDYRLLMFNIGMIGQLFYLKCADLGLGTVVVGAFDDDDVASVVDLSSSFTPIYIVPVGLTPDFYEEREEPPPLSGLGGFFAFLMFIPMFLSMYLSLPKFRLYFKKKARYIHCILGIFACIASILHFTMVHGQVRSSGDIFNPFSYINALIYFFVLFGTIKLTVTYIGYLTANIAILSLVICTLTGFLIPIKRLKHKKLIYKIHKITQFLAIILMITHPLINSTTIAPNPLIFLCITVLLLNFYYLLKYYPKVLVISKLEKSINH